MTSCKTLQTLHTPKKNSKRASGSFTIALMMYKLNKLAELVMAFCYGWGLKDIDKAHKKGRGSSTSVIVLFW